MKKITLASQAIGLLTDVRSRYGWKIDGLVLMMTVVGLTEGIGMALLLPLLDSIGIAGAGETGMIDSVLASFFSFFGIENTVYSVVALLFIVFATQLFLFVLLSWWTAWMQRDYGSYWQRRLFDSLIHANWGFLASQKMGNLVNLITVEATRIFGAFFLLTQIASMIITTFIYMVVAFYISWEISCMILILAFFLFIVMSGIGRKSHQIGSVLGPLASELNVLLTEYFGGAKLIKSTATENQAFEKVDSVIEELRVQYTWATFLPSLVRGIFEFSAIVVLGFILTFGYKSLDIPTASMLVVLAIFIRLLPRLNALQQNLHSMATYVPAFTVACNIFESSEANSERDRLKVILDKNSHTMSGPLRISINKGGYKGITTLKDINLQLPDRGVVGIVGESGAGKSTLANCLLGLAEIKEGTVTFGETRMDEISLTDWRRQLGYVTQETVLFHASIRDNILWGRCSATEDEIVTAARQALAHDFILEQPDGYMTIIGDQGALLSGGQRQRLSIARALLKNPRLLIMDEATSALDSASEKVVLETVENLQKDICVVMIAHRLSTVRNSDMIVVMRNGEIVETGSWDELMARKGELYALAESQHLI